MPSSETVSVETGQPCDLSPTLVTCHRLGYLSPSLPHAGGLEPGTAPCHFQNRSGVQQMGEITFHWLLAASSGPWGSTDVPRLVSARHHVGMTIGPPSWQAPVLGSRPRAQVSSQAPTPAVSEALSQMPQHVEGQTCGQSSCFPPSLGSPFLGACSDPAKPRQFRSLLLERLGLGF